MARRWRIPEHPSPFQSLMIDFMRAQWPMDMADLARALEIPYTTVIGWFTANRIPHAPTLRDIAQHTDIPLAALYRAAGYAVPEPEPAAPPADVISPLMESFLEWARDWPGLDGASRHGLIEHMRAWQRGQYDQFAAQRAAEQHVVEAQPSFTDAQSHTTSQREQATDTQHRETGKAPDRTPEQATRIARKRRKDVAHTARKA